MPARAAEPVPTLRICELRPDCCRQCYGTIRIDFTAQRSVELLPDWERSSVATWLRERPGANVIRRDRSAVYADMAQTGHMSVQAAHGYIRDGSLFRDNAAAQVGLEDEGYKDRVVRIRGEDYGGQTGPRGQEQHPRRILAMHDLAILFGLLTRFLFPKNTWKCLSNRANASWF